MTSGYFLIYKVSFFIKGLIGLGNIVVFLFIGSNIYYFIRNSRLISAVINYSVRSFDKSVLIYTGTFFRNANGDRLELRNRLFLLKDLRDRALKDDVCE